MDERVHLRVQLLGLILLVLPVLSGEFLLLGLDLRQGADPANEGLVAYGLARLVAVFVRPVLPEDDLHSFGHLTRGPA